MREHGRVGIIKHEERSWGIITALPTTRAKPRYIPHDSTSAPDSGRFNRGVLSESHLCSLIASRQERGDWLDYTESAQAGTVSRAIIRVSLATFDAVSRGKLHCLCRHHASRRAQSHAQLTLASALKQRLAATGTVEAEAKP